MAELDKIMKIDRSGALVRAFILLALVAISICLLQFSPIKAYLRPDQFQRIIGEVGPMGTALLVFLCAAGTCLFVPGTVFVGIGAAVFGPYLGFACVWPGVLTGSVISFFTARRLGREFVDSIIGDRLKKYDDLIERNGFKTILFLRLMFLPLGPLNYGSGLTKVRFWDYFFATALGEAVTIFAVTFFIGAIRATWISGDWGQFFSARTALAFAFLIALAFVGKLLQKKYEASRH